jgi:hypothetical protein
MAGKGVSIKNTFGANADTIYIIRQGKNPFQPVRRK